MYNSITPIRLIIYSFLIWAVCYILIPANYITDNTFFPSLVLFLYVFSLYVGIISIKQVNSVKYNETQYLKKVDRYSIIFLFLIGILGSLLKIYHIVFVDRLLSVDAYSLRESQIYSKEFKSGSLGLIIALTFPFSIISFFAIFYYQKYFHRYLLYVSALFASIYIVGSYLNESRLPIVLAAFMFFIIWYFYQKRYGQFFSNTMFIKLENVKLFRIPKFFLKTRVIGIIIVGVLAINFSTRVMVNRLNHYGYKDTLKVWSEYHETEFDEDFKNKIKTLSNEDKNYELAKYSLYHYFAHGIIEFQRLVNHVDDKNGIFYGKYQLDVYYKFLRFLGIEVTSKKEMGNVLYKRGYYTTFWGPFYLDFGLYGIVICFFIGRFIKRTFIKAKKGYLPAILMYSYLAVNLLASFHVTFFSSSYMYIFNAIIVFWLIRQILYMSIKKPVALT